MLWVLLFGYLFFSASADISPESVSSADVETLGSRIMETADGSDREPAVSAVLTELSADYKKFGKLYIKSGKALAKQYKDHAATTADACIVTDKLNDDWRAAQVSVTDLHFELKELLTEDEWNAVYGSEDE